MTNYEQLHKSIKQRKGSHFDGAFIGPLLVDIVTKEIPPQNVRKRDRDHPKRRHEPAEAHGGVDQNRAPELGIDRVVEEEHVEEGQEEKGGEAENEPDLRGAKGSVAVGGDRRRRHCRRVGVGLPSEMAEVGEAWFTVEEIYVGGKWFGQLIIDMWRI